MLYPIPSNEKTLTILSGFPYQRRDLNPHGQKATRF